MPFIDIFDGFQHHSRQPDKINLFISAILSSGQILNSKQLKPDLQGHQSLLSLPRKQPKVSEERKGTGRLHPVIAPCCQQSGSMVEFALTGGNCKKR